MHGDRVVARIERTRDDRAEGRILRILERGASSIVGRFDVDDSGMGFLVPFDRRLIVDVLIPEGERKDAKPGDMVVVEITRWPTPTRSPLGRVVEVLGDIDEPGVDNEIIIRKYGLPDEHGPEAVEEAKRLGGGVKESDIKGRTDFRTAQTVTIDGEHARDFDDAITIERLPQRSLLAGRSHRRRRALRSRRQRARRRSLRARHLRLLSRACRPHVPVRALRPVCAA